MALKKTKIIAFLIAFPWMFGLLAAQKINHSLFTGSPVYAAEEGDKQLPMADSPADCGSRDIYYDGKAETVWGTPINGLLLE